MHEPDRLQKPENKILNLLPQSEYNRLMEETDHIRLDLGSVLCDANEERNHVYFPTSGIVSIIELLEEGESSEIALIGNEGIVGITAVLGGGSQPNRAVVQSQGSAYRMSTHGLRREFRKGGILMDQILLYMQVLYTQVAQTAVCNRHHNLQQQLCRWLLLSLDRIDSDELAMTQELIAGMLGVRREGITRAARQLQKQRIIEYRRGVITVLDRRRLEEACCECYRVVKNETDRLAAIQDTIR